MAISTAVDVSAVARVVGVKTEFKNLRAGGVVYLPQRIAVIGQGTSLANYATTKQTLTTAFAVGSAFGFGSPLHLAALQLLPASGDGVGTLPVTFYPLVDHASGVPAAGDITPSGTPTGRGSYTVVVNGVPTEPFIINIGDNVAAMITAMIQGVNASLNTPVIAANGTTKVNITAKWDGASGNGIKLEVKGPTNLGVSFATVQPVGGLNNPLITPALEQFGNVWESLVLNCLDIADTDTLSLINTFGEGRRGPLVKKPFVAFTGNTATTVSSAIAVSDARKTDLINAQLVCPGSPELPLVVAARQLARIAVTANNNPPRDYGSQEATGITPGPDSAHWTYPDRDLAVKGGSSTIVVKDGVVNIGDVVTFFHPTGDPTPAYRYVVDIVKIQNIVFNINLLFENEEWDGAPLIPDNQPTANREAKKPKSAVAAVCALIDQLALEAIISDPAAAKAATFAQISTQNPKRLDLTTTMKLSGNTNIISVDFNFGFFFGVQEVVA